MNDLLHKAATTIARDSLGLESGEVAVLITDTAIEPAVRDALRAALSSTGAQVRELLVSFDTGNVAMELPGPEVLNGAGAVLAAVSQSLTYNRHLAELRQRGGRVLSMPRISRATLERVAESDFPSMIDVTRRVESQFAGAHSELVMRSPAGTNLTLDISAATPSVTDGVVSTGEIDQIPAGIVSVVGKRAHGDIVITGPVSLLERLDAPIHLRIEDSVIVSISGGESATELARILDGFDDYAAVHHCPAEIGIGTNPSVSGRLDGPFVPEFARALGMIHVGFGDDHLFPSGTVVAPIHGDFLLPDAEIWLDGVQVSVR